MWVFSKLKNELNDIAVEETDGDISALALKFIQEGVKKYRSAHTELPRTFDSAPYALNDKDNSPASTDGQKSKVAAQEKPPAKSTLKKLDQVEALMPDAPKSTARPGPTRGKNPL